MQPLQADDWTSFLRLYQTPEVMRFVHDIQTPAQIHSRFVQRLGNGDCNCEFWLCLLIRDKDTGVAVCPPRFSPVV